MNRTLIVAYHFALGGKPERARLIFEKVFYSIQKGLDALKVGAIHAENTHFGEDSVALKLFGIHYSIDIVMEQTMFDESGTKRSHQLLWLRQTIRGVESLRAMRGASP